MTIHELIEELKKAEQEYGSDTIVAVQHRDGGGEYHGADGMIYLMFCGNEKQRVTCVIEETEKVIRCEDRYLKNVFLL